MSENESDALREELLLHHKKSLEILAGGIAHEFNNTVTSIIGYTQMALQDPENRDLTERALKTSLQAAESGAAIVTRLRHFSGGVRAGEEISDLSASVNDVVALVKPYLDSKAISLKLDLCQTPPVLLDRALFGILLLELLENARDAVSQFPGSALIDIRTRQEDDQAVIYVQDNGRGMTEEELTHAIDPLFTTKGPAGGGDFPRSQGLGLSTAYGIAKRFGGKLTLESKPYEGLLVRIAFPSASGTRGEEPKRILVVDDEIAIRKIFMRFLSNAGYEVAVAECADEAYEILMHESFDAITLDQSMPGMCGTDLLEKWQEGNPPETMPPVIMITAHHSPTLAREAFRLGAHACTAKPINREKILYLVGAAVGNPTPLENPPDLAEEILSVSDRVLVVDAETLVAEVTQILLERTGFSAESVHTAEAAKLATENEYFDLILIDPLLPDMGGPALLHQLRLNNPYTPILATISPPGYQQLPEILQAGATRAIQKPIDVEAILSEVSSLIRVFRTHSPSGSDDDNLLYGDPDKSKLS